MKESDQVKAIAGSLGWKINPFGGMYPPGLNPATNMNQEFRVPDFLNSRDAIIEVVKGLDKCKQLTFIMKLHVLVGYHELNVSGEAEFAVATATARQMAESYLKTLGLWADSPATKEGGSI